MTVTSPCDIVVSPVGDLDVRPWVYATRSASGDLGRDGHWGSGDREVPNARSPCWGHVHSVTRGGSYPTETTVTASAPS